MKLLSIAFIGDGKLSLVRFIILAILTLSRKIYYNLINLPFFVLFKCIFVVLIVLLAASNAN